MATQDVIDVMAVPLNSTKYVVHKLFDHISVQTAILAFLVIFFADWILLSYSGAPSSCRIEDGACRKVLLNFYTMFYFIFVFILFLFWMKLTASGIKAHGLRPSAFVNVFAAYFLFNMLNLIFVQLTTIFKINIYGNDGVDTDASAELKLTDSIRYYIGFLINGFAGKYTFGTEDGGDNDDFTNSNTYDAPDSLFYGVILGVVAGSLA
jgi:hypothetical protein